MVTGPVKLVTRMWFTSWAVTLTAGRTGRPAVSTPGCWVKTSSATGVETTKSVPTSGSVPGYGVHKLVSLVAALLSTLLACQWYCVLTVSGGLVAVAVVPLGTKMLDALGTPENDVLTGWTSTSNRTWPPSGSVIAALKTTVVVRA